MKENEEGLVVPTPPTVSVIIPTYTRQLARSITSSHLVLWSVEQLVNILEKHSPTSSLLPILYRYIIGGYIFQGYREGLNQFTQVNNVGNLI